MTSSQFPVLSSQFAFRLEFLKSFHPFTSVKIRGRFAFVLIENRELRTGFKN
jgi:hypothetical protein